MARLTLSFAVVLLVAGAFAVEEDVCAPFTKFVQHERVYQCVIGEEQRDFDCSFLRNKTPEDETLFKVAQKTPEHARNVRRPTPQCKDDTFAVGEPSMFCCFSMDCCKYVRILN